MPSETRIRDAANKFRNEVGRFTHAKRPPNNLFQFSCAPTQVAKLSNGAHGVTRPTSPLDDVSKLLCRFIRPIVFQRLLCIIFLLLNSNARLQGADGRRGLSGEMAVNEST